MKVRSQLPALLLSRRKLPRGCVSQVPPSSSSLSQSRKKPGYDSRVISRLNPAFLLIVSYLSMFHVLHGWCYAHVFVFYFL